MRKSYIDKNLIFNSFDFDLVLNKILGKANFYLEDKEVAQGIVPNPDIVSSSSISKINPIKIEQHNIKVGDGVFVIPKDFFSGILSETELAYLKPLYEPTDLEKYVIKNINDKEIIYITKGAENENIPHLLNHLGKYSEIMDDRRENISGSLQYFHLHWPRKTSFFEEGSKILVVRKSVNPTFSYTENEAYVMMAMNVIKSERINLKYLTGLLNSKLISFWLKNKGKMQGSNYQLDKEPILDLPIFTAEESRQKEVIDLVDEILRIKKENSTSSTSELESRLDDYVYRLYDLTSDEINIISRN